MGLVEWLSRTTSESVSKSALFEILFPTKDIDQVAIELNVVRRNDELKSKLLAVVDSFTWDVVDEVFRQAKLNNVFSPHLQTVLAFTSDVMNKKEWEIVAFEKAYDWSSSSELAALLFSLQLLLTGDGRDSLLVSKGKLSQSHQRFTSFIVAICSTVLSAILRCLDKVSELQSVDSAVEHFLSFVNGYLCKSKTWRAHNDVPSTSALHPIVSSFLFGT